MAEILCPLLLAPGHDPATCGSNICTAQRVLDAARSAEEAAEERVRQAREQLDTAQLTLGSATDAVTTAQFELNLARQLTREAARQHVRVVDPESGMLLFTGTLGPGSPRGEGWHRVTPDGPVDLPPKWRVMPSAGN